MCRSLHNQFCNSFRQLAAIFASLGADDLEILPALANDMVFDRIRGFNFVVGFTSGFTALYIKVWLAFSFAAQLSASLTPADSGIAAQVMHNAVRVRFDLRLRAGVIIVHAPSINNDAQGYGRCHCLATRFSKNWDRAMRMTQIPVPERKKPVQARATVTVDTILEATAQILEGGDPARFTTNHIAEHAGYSVGTLYGYFRDKQSLLRAIALREIARQERELLMELDSVDSSQSDDDIIRTVVRAALRPFGNRGQLRLAMMQQLADDAEIMAATDGAQKKIMDVFLALFSMRYQRHIEFDSNSRFTLLASVAGAVQRTAQDRPELFGSSRFENDIVGIVRMFLDQRLHPA
jgi:AcrR family transcriptional regulator